MAIEVRGMVPLIEVFDMPASLAFYRDRLGSESRAIQVRATIPVG